MSRPGPSIREARSASSIRCAGPCSASSRRIGGYVAHRADGVPLALDPTVAVRPELTEQERMAGSWALASMGDVLCAWTSAPASDGMSGGLERFGECRPEWLRVVGWRRAEGRIMLIDADSRVVKALPGDSIIGFFSPLDGEENLGFVRGD